MTLPVGTDVFTDSDARGIMRESVRDTAYNPTFTTVALDLIGRWSDRHSQKIVDLVWKGLEAGASLFVRPDFLAHPPVDAESEEIEGYKQYIKE